MAEIIDLCARRAERSRSQLLAQPLDDLLYGPITAEIADVFEFLTDAEIEAFFRARARAQLDQAMAGRPNFPEQP